ASISKRPGTPYVGPSNRAIECRPATPSRAWRSHSARLQSEPEAADLKIRQLVVKPVRAADCGFLAAWFSTPASLDPIKIERVCVATWRRQRGTVTLCLGG